MRSEVALAFWHPQPSVTSYWFTGNENHDSAYVLSGSLPALGGGPFCTREHGLPSVSPSAPPCTARALSRSAEAFLNPNSVTQLSLWLWVNSQFDLHALSSRVPSP